MNIDNRQRTLAVIAIAAIGLLAGDKLVLSPLLNSWKERSARTEDIHIKLVVAMHQPVPHPDNLPQLGKFLRRIRVFGA